MSHNAKHPILLLHTVTLIANGHTGGWDVRATSTTFVDGAAGEEATSVTKCRSYVEAVQFAAALDLTNPPTVATD